MKHPSPNDHRERVAREAFYQDDLRQMSLAVNYLRWQFDLIRPFLGRRILEIGAGTGNLALRMAEIAEEIVCIEPNDSCHSELARRVGSVPWRRDSPHVC